MNRQQAKALLPIIQAFAEGRPIERKGKSVTSKWKEVIEPTFYIDMSEYRIKPEPKYRPFKDAEECWQEMLKHQPFGWIKKISGHGNFLYIMELYPTGIVINDVDAFGGFKNLLKTYNFAFAEITFADDTPFGMKKK